METKSSSLSLSVDRLNVQKPQKASEASNGNHFRAVEEKLNKLLDLHGGISRHEDVLEGFLELLLLAKTIQSNRDLSMILDALLKTRSRTVLGYIVNKNGGLRMLGKLINKFNQDFKKTPIMRMLLKVLEYLVDKKILTSEHIKKDSSFRESLLTLTEHEDKQVHQIARNFRDKWIPKYLRGRISDRDDKKPGFSGSSNYNGLSRTRSIGSDCVRRSSESIYRDKQSAPSTPDVPVPQSSVTRTGKRKSQWDQPAETYYGFSTPRHVQSRSLPSSVRISSRF